MRSYITAFLILCAGTAFAGPKDPIWEEQDEHFRYYRGLMVESQLSHLRTKLDQISYDADAPFKVRELVEVEREQDVLAAGHAEHAGNAP